MTRKFENFVEEKKISRRGSSNARVQTVGSTLLVRSYYSYFY